MAQSAILLSTYNGEKYLEQQLNSLEEQTYKKWDLIVRDDGSTDRTLTILKSYIKSTDHTVILIEDHLSLGASKSFLSLLGKATEGNYDYIFFCDQDDVWKPFKMEASINKINKVASENHRLPVLVHTDLEIVDADLNPIYPSMWQANNTKPQNNRPNNYLVENNVTGCTIVLNKAAADLIVSISHSIQKDKIVMHDWWSALITSIFGQVAFVNEKTIYYRQHSNNTIGLNKKKLVSKLNDQFINEKNALINHAIYQSQEIYKYMLKSKFENTDILNLVKDYSGILYRSFLTRLKILGKYKLRKTSYVDNLGYKTILLLKKKKK